MTALSDAGALESFRNSAPSMRKEYVRQVMEAKAQETSLQQITKIIKKNSWIIRPSPFRYF